MVMLLSDIALPCAAQAWLDEGASPQIVYYDGIDLAASDEEDLDCRGKVVVRRISPQCYSDWNNDPTALPYLFYQIERRTNGEFPTYVDNTGLTMIDDEMFDYPIIMFTSHFPFSFNEVEVENLQRFIAMGGTLMLDDCTGSGPFMDSVPVNVQRIAPGAETHLMLPSGRFGDLFTMIYHFDRLPELREDFCKPFQATIVNGRPAIMFCPNDYGCLWEVASPPSAMHPLGIPFHGHNLFQREEVCQFSINWLFFALCH